MLPTEEVSEHEHEIKVKISKTISETADVFHGGIPDLMSFILTTVLLSPERRT